MTHYRIYGLNQAGSFAWGVDAICWDDAEATEVARAVPRPELEREVWRGTTRVALLVALHPCRQKPMAGAAGQGAHKAG